MFGAKKVDKTIASILLFIIVFSLGNSFSARADLVSNPEGSGIVNTGANWMFFGDSQTRGAATDQPTAVSHVEAFENIWNGNTPVVTPDLYKSGVGGCTIAESTGRYENRSNRGDATWVHFQESGNQNYDSQRTPEAFANGFEDFVRQIVADSPSAIISTETAYSFERESVNFRDWTGHNIALKNKIFELGEEGITVHLADVDRNMKDYISNLGFDTVIREDGGHFRGNGNLLVALTIYDTLGYDVSRLDLSAITDVSESDRELARTIAINNGVTSDKCTMTYSNEVGTANSAVGNSEDRNTYRGIYWTGPTKSICSTEIQLDVRGDISAIDFETTVWEVDPQNDLAMTNLLARSNPVNGADIVANAWQKFEFPSEVTLTTGKTVLVVSRVDAGTRDGSNFIAVKNGYDENDLESAQWNIHYGSNQQMAGRGVGDDDPEDQPEYFTFNIRLNGKNIGVESSTEVPNMPENIEVVPYQTSDTLRISWEEKGVNNVEIDHYNIYEYTWSDAGKELIGSTQNLYFDHTGLEPSSTHYYVVTAVSTSGTEGYHSLQDHDIYPDNDPDWGATTLDGNTCTPEWNTGTWSDWSTCTDSNQTRTRTRTVTDNNSCGIDTDKPSESETQTCGIIEPPTPGDYTFETRATDSVNTAEEHLSNGYVSISSSDLEMTMDTTAQAVGLHFPNIEIPVGATVTNAYIQFTANETNSEDTSLVVNIENIANSPAITTSSRNLSTRLLTGNSVNWDNIPAWENIGDTLEAQRTPNLSSIVQNIVDLSDWNSGNALTFIVTGDGRRVAESGGGTGPMLHIEYSTGTNSCTPEWNIGAWSDWSECSDSNQNRTRIVTDNNSCSDDANKPIENENQACSVIIPVEGSGANTRTERWGSHISANHANDSMDTWLRSNYPTYTYGNSNRIEVDNNGIGLLYFDISNLESTDIIKKTTIKLMTRKVYASNAGYEDGSIIEAYEINDNGQSLWNEEYANYNNRASGSSWDGNGGDITSVLSSNPIDTFWYTPYSFKGTDHPHWQEIDVTELAKEWIAGTKENHGIALLMNKEIGFNPIFNTKETTLDNPERYRPYIEITYERNGQGNVDRPAQINNINAFHRSGQTFITFDELEMVEEFNMENEDKYRYKIYRNNEPITSENILESDEIANLARGSGKMQWALEWADFTDGLGEMHVINDYDSPLSEGTGLFVYTSKEGNNGNYYYAVTAVVDGNENLTDFDTNNSTNEITETYSEIKRPVAVLDSSDGMNTQYMMWMDYDKWPLYLEAASHHASEPLRGESYAFGFRVGKPTGNGPHPLVMHLNAYGAHGVGFDNGVGPRDYSGNHVWLGLNDTYTVWHDDNFRLWHFGGHDSLWTGKVPGAEYGSRVLNVREKFYSEILKWMESPNNFANYNVNPLRKYLAGGSMGGTGTQFFGVHHPEFWAGLYVNEGINNWETVGTEGGSAWQGDVIPKWGDPSRTRLPVYDMINESYSSLNTWDHMNLYDYMAENRGGDVSLLTSQHGTADNVIEWNTQGRAWYMDDSAYELNNYPFFGGWQHGGHTPDVRPDKTPMFLGRLDEAILSFTNSNNNDNVSGVEFDEDTAGEINKELEWSNSANNFDGEATDTNEEFSIGIRLDPTGDIETDTVDITPRRMQNFITVAGQTYNYQITDIENQNIVTAGTVTADSDGLITLTNVGVNKTGIRLHISSNGIPENPIIDLSTNSLDFVVNEGSNDTISQIVTINNSSTGTLNWNASIPTGESWINLTNSSGTDGENLEINVDPTGLFDGEYSSQVEITDSGASNSPKLINVSLTVNSVEGYLHTVNVSNYNELRTALINLESNTEVLVADGIYNITQTLAINGGVQNVALRSESGNRENVVFRGPGWNDDSIEHILMIRNAQNVLVSDMTFRDVFYHPIIIQGEQGAENPTIRNMHLIDAGEQFIKTTYGGTSTCDNGIVENNLIEYTTNARRNPARGDYYTQGVDVHRGSNWIIRDNTFRNIRAPEGSGELSGAAIIMWNQSKNTIVERNKFINCDFGIEFGNAGGPENDHEGGIIRNNTIYRTAGNSGDVGISVNRGRDVKIYNNTVILNGTYPNAIEYRFTNTYGENVADIRNNLTDANITSRNDAPGLEVNNFENATSDYFIDIANNDLRLTSNAISAVNQATVLSDVTDDIDQVTRDSNPNIGAYEYVETVSLISDTQSPTTPQNINTDVTFSWDASTDNIGVTGYRVYRNGSEIGTSTTTSYTDTILLSDTEYNYTITAFDNAGNESNESTQILIQTTNNNVCTSNWNTGAWSDWSTCTDSSQSRTRTVTDSNSCEDDTNKPTESEVQSCTVQTGDYNFQTRANSVNDTAEEFLSNGGEMYLNSSDLEMAHDVYDQAVGIHFDNIEVPDNVEITNAYIQFTADEAHSGDTSLIINIENTANSNVIGTGANDLSNRISDGYSVAWNNVAAWENVGDALAAQRTPNLSSVIQSVITGNDWANGNAMTFIITGSGTRTADAYGSTGPKLVIEYSIIDETPVFSTGSIDIQISNANDDAEEYVGSHSVNLASSDIEMVVDGSAQYAGYRFNGLYIPQGSTITNAYIQFSVDENNSEETNLIIHGEGSDNSTPFTTADNNISLRELTNTSINWDNIPAWETRLTRGEEQRTPDISSIVQEIVNRGGWNEGSSMSFIINGTGKRVAVSANSTPAHAASLHIEYSSEVVSCTPEWNIGTWSEWSTCTDSNQTRTRTITDNNYCSNDTNKPIESEIQACIVQTGNEIFETRATSSNNTAEEFLSNNGSMYLTSSDLEMCTDVYDQAVGIHFDNIEIPANAQITNAYLQFTADETHSEETSLVVNIENIANSPVIGTGANDLSNRISDGYSVAWDNVPAWENVGDALAAQRTPNMSSMVQSVITGNNWTTGNAMTFIITGNGRRTADAYGSTGPKLVIEYVTQ